MRNSLLIAAIFFLSAVQCSAAGNYNDQWKKGNDFYRQKQYDSAALYFEQLAALRPQNAEVYYNLGNTYYRLNKIAPAVLNYERALRIEPDYKEAKDNLLLAQSRISNYIAPASDIFFVKWWRSLTEPTKAGTWATATLITFTLVMVVIMLRRFQKTFGPRIPVQLAGFLWLTCFCFLMLAFSSARSVEQHNTAVVMQNDVPLMNNEQKGKPLVLVPEGTTVKIRTEKGSWAEVSLPDGRTGWMQQNLINKI
jgi:hypothetical protein